MLLFRIFAVASFLMCYAQCGHGDGSGVRHVHMKYHGHLLYYQATVLAKINSDGRHMCSKYHGHTHYYQATNCLRLFVVVICCCHGDGSDGRHVFTQYHGHTHLRLFVVVIGDGSDGGHVCTKYRGHTYYYQQLMLERCFTICCWCQTIERRILHIIAP